MLSHCFMLTEGGSNVEKRSKFMGELRQTLGSAIVEVRAHKPKLACSGRKIVKMQWERGNLEIDSLGLCRLVSLHGTARAMHVACIKARGRILSSASKNHSVDSPSRSQWVYQLPKSLRISRLPPRQEHMRLPVLQMLFCSSENTQHKTPISQGVLLFFSFVKIQTSTP